MNSRDKGKRGELELAALLRDAGFEARRGAQFNGADSSPDVVHSIPGIHIEVKRTGTLRLWEAFAQAVRDCGNKMPTVWHRPNRKPWIVILSAEDFLAILKAAAADKPPIRVPPLPPGHADKPASRRPSRE